MLLRRLPSSETEGAGQEGQIILHLEDEGRTEGPSA